MHRNSASFTLEITFYRLCFFINQAQSLEQSMASTLVSDAVPSPTKDQPETKVPSNPPVADQEPATDGQIRSRLPSAKEKVDDPTEHVTSSVASDPRPSTAQKQPSETAVHSSRPPSARPPSAVKHEQKTTADDSPIAPPIVARPSSDLPVGDPQIGRAHV